MRAKKNPYELMESQVQTPASIVSLFWDLLDREGNEVADVLDMGAGDGRFAKEGRFFRYTGIEIDAKAAKPAVLPSNARIKIGCAFRHREQGYDACIGNPPYVRHHDIESPWKEKIRNQLSTKTGFPIDLHGNLYLYFLCLALLKTHDKGVVGMVVPFEWVSRPSALAVRNYIKKNQWDVKVYRFKTCIFKNVLTTASITIINKRKRKGTWQFKNISQKLRVESREGATGSGKPVLPHKSRSEIWTLRGMSPGSQKLFTLTDGERIHCGLTKTDVIPCVTSLRYVPKSLKVLDKQSFKTHFVEAGLRCWLIKSRAKKISPRVKNYLDHIPVKARSTYTCLNQEPWYAYEDFPVPALLLHSAFTSFGPKVLLNTIGAKAVGSVYGIHSTLRINFAGLQDYLLKFNFESRVVSHSKVLKKVEVRQVNGVLQTWQKSQGVA